VPQSEPNLREFLTSRWIIHVERSDESDVALTRSVLLFRHTGKYRQVLRPALRFSDAVVTWL
jgi:hypothetical protein